MINPQKLEQINPLKLPSLPLVERSQLPKIPAIYFVLEGKTIIYIGQSINLVGRFKNHNRLRQFKKLKDIRISWLEFHNSEVEFLLEIEKLLINHFKPILNSSNCRNKRTDPGYIQIAGDVKEEIGLKFKAVCTLNEISLGEGLEKAILLWLKQEETNKNHDSNNK